MLGRYPILFLVWLAALSCEDADRAAPVADTLSAHSGLEIGAGPDAPRLSQVVGIVGGPDRRLYVTDFLTPHVLVFDEAGAFIDSIGRRGSGPGEFNGIGTLGFVRDTLWVRTNQRVELFTRTGSAVGRASFYSTGADGTTTRTPSAYAGEGAYLAEERALPQLIAAGDAREARVVRTSGSGDELEVLAAVSQPRNLVEVRAGDEWASWFIADDLAPPNIAFFPRHPGFATIVDHRHQGVDSLTIRWRDEVGQTTAVSSIGLPDVPFPESLRAEIERGTAERLARDGWPVERVRPLVADQLPWPARAPAYQRVIAAGDRRVWLRRGHDDETSAWQVLAPSGETVNVDLPSGFILHYADGRHVWGVILDDFDVPHLWRFEIGEAG